MTISLRRHLSWTAGRRPSWELTRFDGGAPVGDRLGERVLTSQFALLF